MAEYKRQIVMGGGIAVVAVVALAGVITYLTLNSQPVTPAQFYFGSLPYLYVTPGNRTFSIPLEVRAHPSATLSFDPSHSYAVEFSNGTQWVYSPSGACGLANSTISTTTGFPPGTNVCSFEADNYLPEHGVVTNASVKLASSKTTVSVSPSNLPANFVGSTTLTVHIGLPPGVYALNLALDVASNGGPSGVWNLGLAPLTVRA